MTGPVLAAVIVSAVALFLIYSNQGGAVNIAQYAKQAGFEGNDLVTAVAIALAESSGNIRAYNPEAAAGTPEGQGSYGLWQIYLYAHPEFSGDDLYDPQINANDAYEVYSKAGNSFSPWSTFKNGKYQTQLVTALSQVQGISA